MTTTITTTRQTVYSMDLRKVAILPHNCTLSQPRRQRLEMLMRSTQFVLHAIFPLSQVFLFPFFITLEHPRSETSIILQSPYNNFISVPHSKLRVQRISCFHHSCSSVLYVLLFSSSSFVESRCFIKFHAVSSIFPYQHLFSESYN
jgi:hypothetical protein